MSVIIFLLGFVVSAAGLATLLFGVSIIEFSLGGTLVTAGSVGFTGGLVMIAVAAAMRELRRIADALPGRLPPHFARPGDAFEGLRLRPANLGAADRMRAPAAEPRKSADDSIDTGRSSAEAEQDPLHEPRLPEPAELSAQPPRTGEAGDRGAAMPAAEHIPTSGEIPDKTADDRSPAVPLAQFDTFWPRRERAMVDRESVSDRVTVEPEPSLQPAPPERPEHAGGTASSAGDGNTSQAAEPRPVSILKSGVVDGMAYTLYSDGSIEAELPDGMIRFASIDELRMHLEKTA